MLILEQFNYVITELDESSYLTVSVCVCVLVGGCGHVSFLKTALLIVCVCVCVFSKKRQCLSDPQAFN